MFYTFAGRYLIWKIEEPLAGFETEEDMALEVHSSPLLATFYFHSAIAVMSDRRTLYCCIAISDYTIARYRYFSSVVWFRERGRVVELEVVKRDNF